jgi:GNAT superfamily N-acetyltransferase
VEGKLDKVEYRKLHVEEISRELFRDFIRHQKVTKCLRRQDGEWVVKDDPFIDDWSEEDYRTLVSCLKNTVTTGGFVYAAFADGSLKAFASVEAEAFGREREYLDLSCIHVSEEFRGQGVGRALFCAAKEWARVRGAKKLYISAHSAVETQAFYKAMGCVEAQEYNPKHVEAEPYDCQMECSLDGAGEKENMLPAVREACFGDLAEILALYLFLHEKEIPEDNERLRMTWKRIVEDENHHLIVCEVDGKIVSSCVCVIIPNLTRNVRPYAFVENVVTHGDYRGRGYATKCLHYAKEIARAANCYKMMLLTGSKQESTLDFYRNAGYNSADKTAFVQWLEP